MNGPRTQHLIGWIVLLFGVFAFGVLIFSEHRLSAASQLALSVLLLVVLGVGMWMICYQALGPSEVLVVSRRGKPPQVMRGGALIFPLMSWTTRVHLRSMWVEFPKDAKGDGSATLNRENRLITKDGLPVTTRVDLLIQVGNDDASILNVARTFSDSSDYQIRDHFTKILGGIVAKVVAETDSLDLSKKHEEFDSKVYEAAKFELSGHQVIRIQRGQ